MNYTLVVLQDMLKYAITYKNNEIDSAIRYLMGHTQQPYNSYPIAIIEKYKVSNNQQPDVFFFIGGLIGMPFGYLQDNDPYINEELYSTWKINYNSLHDMFKYGQACRSLYIIMANAAKIAKDAFPNKE